MDGFVLAGGASRRFGQDKALAVVDGERLIDRVVAALSPHCTRVRVVRRPGQAPVPGHDVLVGDEGDDRHPLWGLAVALEAAEGALALVTPCDLVGLREGHVGALVGQGPCVAWDGQHGQPLLGVFPSARAADARDAARDGIPVRRFVADMTAISLPMPALRNLNRPR
jgi:molybdopterin-guanine dinucleotide biosynthesis protein A